MKSEKGSGEVGKRLGRLGEVGEEMNNSPPQPRRGGCATEEILRSHIDSRRRGGAGLAPLMKEIFWSVIQEKVIMRISNIT